MTDRNWYLLIGAFGFAVLGLVTVGLSLVGISPKWMVWGSIPEFFMAGLFAFVWWTVAVRRK